MRMSTRYLISFLEKFICSQAVLDVVGDYRFVLTKIIQFLRKHVYTQKTLYLHYMQSNIRHFDTAHSSPHEGTNHGLKSHSCGVKPNMNIDSSTNTINTQTSIRVHECEEIIFQEAHCTHKKWSNLPTSSHTVNLAEGILQQMMSQMKCYQSSLVSRDTAESVFQVTYSESRTLPHFPFETNNGEETWTINNESNDDEQEYHPFETDEREKRPLLYL